jgi:hypothetical protein
LKKSLSEQAVVRNTQESRPKHYKTVGLDPELGPEMSLREFFNRLG